MRGRLNTDILARLLGLVAAAFLAVTPGVVHAQEATLESLEAALKLDPTDAESRYMLGMAYAKAGRMEDALREVKEAVATEPDNPEFHQALALILERKGDKDGALAEFEKAFQLAETPEAQFDLARGFIDADRRATDEELWSLIVAFAPVHDATLLERTPGQLRAEGLTDGARTFLESPSALFVELLAADVRDGTSWSTAYYEHAVSLGFMTASLDDHTDRNELLAIERFRGALLEAITKGRVAGPRPSATRSGFGESVNSCDSRSVPSPTVTLAEFGTSIPTNALPGIGASIRIPPFAASASARFCCNATIFESRTPSAGLIA